MERERRSNDRQRLRFLSKEEQDRLLELQRRKEEEDKKLLKDQQAALKQRKGQEQEEYKKSREREKAEEAEKKERLRKLEQEKKDLEKAEERAKKEENKRESKLRQNHKKDIVAELKKYRNDVATAVLQAFDDEEKESEIIAALVTDADIDILPSKESCPPLYSNTLENLLYNELKPLPGLANVDPTESTAATHASWSDFFAVANYVYLFRSLLDVEHVADFETLVKCLSGCSVDEDVFFKCKVMLRCQIILFINFSLFLNVIVSSAVTSRASEGKDEPAVDRMHRFANNWDSNATEALLERIQLNLLKLLVPSINGKFDLDQKDSVETTKKEKRQQTGLPLNQLTWNEMTRISLIQYLFSEMNRSKDDIQHAVRGSKAGNFRSAKNICRNIRYKWYIRHTVDVASARVWNSDDVDLGEDSEDRTPYMRTLLGFGPERLSTSTAEEDRVRNEQRGKLRPCESVFSNFEELVEELNRLSESDSYPEVYRRCGKVLLRIVKMQSAQQFLWEIDQESPSYYASIVRPIMFGSIANNLIQRSYDEPEPNDDEMDVDGEMDQSKILKEFYADMKQVIFNCFTYNTELATVMSSAQKLLQAIYRHVDRWILASDRPPIDCCDDKCCLLTQEKIVHQKTVNIKCGKCSGIFNLDSVENVFLSETVPDKYKAYADFFITPTDELVNQATEEWHCPFCMKEDFIMLKAMMKDDRQESLDRLLLTRSSFYVDEWGSSGSIPWIFNPIHSHVLKQFEKRESHLLPIVEALHIVGNQQLSCITSDAFNGNRRVWSIGERIKVLKALFVLLQTSENGFKFISKLNDDGEKLMKYCSKASFREAEFVSYVKEICGESGVAFSRKLLDGFDFASDGPSVDYTSQNFIEGRCMLCNASTIAEEDDENNSSSDLMDNQAILCDGCNGEAHLRCLGMETVPKVSWYCSTCSVRQSRRQKKSDVLHLDNIELHRDKEEEEELIWKCVERKIKGKDVFREVESHQVREDDFL
jgi:hypothetical protein